MSIWLANWVVGEPSIRSSDDVFNAQVFEGLVELDQIDENNVGDDSLLELLIGVAVRIPVGSR